jgi:hypothetical protein
MAYDVDDHLEEIYLCIRKPYDYRVENSISDSLI